MSQRYQDLLAECAFARETEREVAELFEEPECRAAEHGPRSSNCTCEDARDE